MRRIREIQPGRCSGSKPDTQPGHPSRFSHFYPYLYKGIYHSQRENDRYTNRHDVDYHTKTGHVIALWNNICDGCKRSQSDVYMRVWNVPSRICTLFYPELLFMITSMSTWCPVFTYLLKYCQYYKHLIILNRAAKREWNRLEKKSGQLCRSFIWLADNPY